MPSQILNRIARLGVKKPHFVLVTVALLTLLSLLSLSQLRIDTRISSLMPAAMTDDFMSEVGDWGYDQFLFVTFDIPEKHSVGAYDGYIRGLKRRLAKLEDVMGPGVQNLAPPRKAVFDYVLEHGILLLSRQQIAQLSRHLEPRGIRAAFLQKNYNKTRFDFYDPLKLLPIIEQAFPMSRFIRFSKKGDYFMSANKDVAVFVLDLSRLPDDFGFSRQLQEQLAAIERDAWMLDQSDFVPKDLPRITAQATGPHLIFLADRDQMQWEFYVISLLALFGIAVLFWLFFRDFRRLAYSITVILCGTLWTLALGQLCFGALNFATVSVAAVTLGLGIDFCIHLLNRYGQERRQGYDHEPALLQTWGHTGRSVLYAALSSALVFYLLGFSQLEGFRELGFLLGSGVLLTALLALFLLPSLMSVAPLSVPRSPRESFLMKALLALLRHRVMTVGIAVGLFAIAIVLSLQLRFQFYESNVHSSRNQPWQIMQSLEEKMGASLMQVSLVTVGDSLEQALRREESFSQQLKQLQNDGSIAGFTSLSQWLPSQKHQAQTRQQLERHSDLDPATFHKNYLRILDQLKQRAIYFQDQYPGTIRGFLQGRESLTPRLLREAGLGSLLDVHLRESKTGVRLRTQVYVPRQRDGVDTQRLFLETIQKNPLVTGGVVYPLALKDFIAQLEPIVVQDAWGIGLIGLLFVTVLAWFLFRKTSLVLLSLVPLLFGTVLMLGSLSLLRLPLDFISILWIPVIIGIGIDDGFHLVARWQEEGKVERALGQVSRPLVLTSLTTMAAFGSLVGSSFLSLQVAGALMVLGIFWTLLASLILLPALLRASFANFRK